MVSFVGGLRFRLILLVVFATLPSAGLILYSGYEQRRLARIDAQQDALRLANLVSVQTEQVIQMTRQLVMTVAQFPEVVDGGTQSCARILEGLKNIHQFNRALLVARPDGEVICASVSNHGSVNLADREYFQRAVKTRDFAISDFVIGRLTGKPSMGFAYPSVDRTGQIRKVVVATLDLSWLVKSAPAARLPEGSVVNIIDRGGTVLARWPNPEPWVGRTLPDAQIIKIVLSGRDGVAEEIGIEGIPRIYGFKPLGPDQQAGFVYVGIPQKIAYGPANQILTRNLVGLGAVTVLGLSLAGFFGNLFIMRGVTALVGAAKQVASANLSARTGLKNRTGEIGQLAAAFDEMATALQEREVERKQAEEEIHRNAARAQLLADISREFGAAGLDRASVLSTVARRVSAWFDDTCFLRLVGEDGQLPESSACYYSYPPRLHLAHEMPPAPEDREHVLLSQVVQSGDPILIPARDPEWIPQVYLDTLHCQSLLMVAMRADEQIVGTLTLVRDRPDRPHTYEDASLLQDVADRTAISVAKASLVETIQRLNAELEEKVKERTSQLTAANKELEAFAYSVSHDLRAPLRAIDGFSRMVLEKYSSTVDAKGRDYLQRTRSSAQRMGQLIDDLLNLSRLTRSPMLWKEIDLSALAREIEAELRETQPDRAVAFLVADNLLVRGDEHLLRTALENLLGNAWKFTGNTNQACVEFGVSMHEGEPVFFVSDNGAGFDMEYADQLFGAFQRLHSMTEFPGTGIGLAIVQRVIHRHGGSIWAEGVVDQGATFYFKFPKRGEF